MITEDYVSLEIAKLLREKGFDWDIYAYYEDENNPNISLRASKAINWNKTEFISKPTHQMAMKWLREVHFLFIDIDPLTGYKWSWSIWLMNDPTQKMGESSEVFSTYKEVVESAIKYCLEDLI